MLVEADPERKLTSYADTHVVHSRGSRHERMFVEADP
jgi:hypothetical protein